MSDANPLVTHYTRGDLLEALRAGIHALGKTTETVGVDDLAPTDEFHIGGREASKHFLDQLQPSANDHVLDAGCGLGGTGRFIAHHYGSRVTGIDLTAEYIETGRVLSRWVGLDQRISLEQGSVTAMPFGEATFDLACMMHVGMNIPDKQSMAAELYRVLGKGGRIGIYDLMRIGEGELRYPVPWADDPATSAVGSPEEYRDALERAGFRVISESDRTDFALAFFERVRAMMANDGPPPLGLHILMGETAPMKLANVAQNISSGRLAPIELIAEK